MSALFSRFRMATGGSHITPALLSLEAQVTIFCTHDHSPFIAQGLADFDLVGELRRTRQSTDTWLRSTLSVQAISAENSLLSLIIS